MQNLIHQSIEIGATNYPDQVAFRFRSESLTYRTLFLRACQVANVLRARGLKPNDRVGIHMPKSIELPIAVYGILIAGGAYVPVDANAPKNRIEFIIRDCGIRFLITNKEKHRTITSLETREDLPIQTVIGINREDTTNREYLAWSDIFHSDPTRPVESNSEDDLAYIMYTSGSTGIPKGLMHTHRSGLAYARFSSNLYGVTRGDILGNHAPLHFDISTFEFLTGPYIGATSVLIPEEEIMFPASLARFIEREKLSFWYSVPLALIQLLTRGELEGVDLSSLRWVLFGGEPFPPKHLEALMYLLPKAKFSNVYGPAEVNQCTFYNIPQDFTADETSVPIGEVWPGATGIIVDENGNQTKGSALGELLISSSTMMRGYWNRDDLNENAFATYKLTQGSPQTFYRTGDLVFRNEQGKLMFSGRKDRQVKIRGYRVELEEIEATLTSCDSIEEAAVFVVPGHDDTIRLASRVSVRSGFEYDEKTILDFLRINLPTYAIPESIQAARDFPRTASGKIDRNQLSQVDQTGS